MRQKNYEDDTRDETRYINLDFLTKHFIFYIEINYFCPDEQKKDVISVRGFTYTLQNAQIIGSCLFLETGIIHKDSNE